MDSSSLDWKEPVVRVQHLSESRIQEIPDRYVKVPFGLPNFNNFPNDVQIPTIDMSKLYSNDSAVREKTSMMIHKACKEWGFFELVNHGVSHELMERMREAWLDFFNLPFKEKEKYANHPSTKFEGYGSRIGIDKGQLLDWRDYYKLHYLPESTRSENKWPTRPLSLRPLAIEYFRQTIELAGKLKRVISSNLGLKESYLYEAFGGADFGTHMQANYYPKCPQAHLAIGLSSHSDLGGLTLLCPDYDVSGLQVRRGNDWVTIKAARGSFIVNLGDQIEIISNGIYQSPEHRVIVNSDHNRFSMAVFNNPNDCMVIKPAAKLVTVDRPQKYPARMYKEHKATVATKEPAGRSHMDKLKLK